MVLAPAEQLLDGFFERIEAEAARGGDGDLVLPARDLVVGDEIALVVAFQYRRAGRCKLRDQTVDDRDVIVALRVGAVDDVDEKIRVFQLLERGAEGLDQMSSVDLPAFV